MAAFPCSHTRFRTNRLSLNTSPFYGLQLDEEVRFEQLSESWTCEPQHVRLHQIAILLGTYPRLLLHEVLFPSPPPPPPPHTHPNPKCLALLPSLPLITRLPPATSLLSLFYHSVNAFVPCSLACLATFCCQPLPPLSALCRLFHPFRSPSSGCF